MRVEALYRIPLLSKSILKLVNEMRRSPGLYRESDGDTYQGCVDIIASDRAGVYAPEYIAEFFGFDALGYHQDEDCKWYHEDAPETKWDSIIDDPEIYDTIDRHAAKMSDALNEAMAIPDVTVYFEWDDGDFGLFMRYQPTEE